VHEASSTDLIPRPDPTRLTTDAVNAATAQWRRDLEALRELIETRLDGMDRAIELAADARRAGYADMDQTRNRLREEIVLTTQQLRELIETRLDGMDRAIELHAEIIDKLPHERNVAIAHLEALQNERFASIAKQFDERDIRTSQASEAAKQALDAALLAAKELVSQQNEANATAADKAEQSTIKQIDQIGIRIDTIQKALDVRLTELKERIDRGEGSITGATVQRTEQRLTIGAVMAVIAGVVGVAAIIVTIVLASRH
jgi:hypothetical protein